MPSNANIYSMIREPKPLAGPLDQYGQLLNIRQAMNANELGQLQRTQLERSMDADTRLRDLFSRGTPKPEEVMAIDPARGIAFQKSALEGQKTQAELEKARAETFLKNVEILKAVSAQASSDADMPRVRETALRLFGPETAAHVPERFSPEWQRQVIMDAPKRLESLTPKLQPVGGQVMDLNPATNPAARGAPVTPTAAERDASQRGWAGLNRPTWDADRGMFITPPRVGPATPPYAAAPGPAAAPAAPSAPPPVQAQPAPSQPILSKAEIQKKVEDDKRKEELGRTLSTYVEARNGLMSGLAGSETGYFAGRMPAMTSEQQIAEGGVAAMAPVLKQLFRVAGEGVFTDRDQQLLLDMVPKRTDREPARVEKMANIDRIVAAKLGMKVPEYVPVKRAKPKQSNQSEGIKFLGFE